MNEELYQKRYAALNSAQKKAVDTLEGPVLVVAGPGSGKTELLSLRVANILVKTDLPPSSVLCLTFTDSASTNMQKRLAGIMGAEAYKVGIHTFHSFGMSVLHRFPEYLYKSGTPQPTDELTRFEILEEALKELSHDNPLRSFSDDYGYSYLKDIMSRLSDLKQGGLAPDEFREIVLANEKFLEKANALVSEVFAPGVRVSTSLLPQVAGLAEKIAAVEEGGLLFGRYESLGRVVAQSLRLASDDASLQSSTKPVTKWKRDFVAKNRKKESVLKASLDTEKQLALCEVYEKYQQKLAEKEYADFDDMILRVVKAMEENAELKYRLQEQYQYILVDEFQDTSGAQMRLLSLLLDNEVNEGRPNVLAVGDDDQAIYKFQGAKLENILRFQERYKGVEVIVLTENYRSTQKVLDIIRAVVQKGEDRLETRLDEVTKELVSANGNLKDGEIVQQVFVSQFEEFSWLSRQVKERMQRGEDLREVAVISRNHKELMVLAKYLDFLGVPVSYDRKKNIFEQPHVMQLVTMLRYVESLNKAGEASADELLPQILAAEFWGVSRLDLWNISVTAYSPFDYKGKKLWLQVMREHESEKVRGVAEFLITVAGYASVWTAEEVVDALTGAVVVDGFVSPFKEFYFSGEKFEQEKDKYMDYLYALQAFVRAVRGYHGGREALTVRDLVEFVELHERHKIALTYESVFNSRENAVQLLTAHKAKGLEFETVYIVNCVDDAWFPRARARRITFPPNVPLSPAEDEFDDAVRLFYVALSRAKRNVYMTLHTHEENGREKTGLRLLEEEDVKALVESTAGSEREVMSHGENDEERLREFYELKLRPQKYEYHSDDENALLKKQLEGYQLSVTHLSNFLDVERGGPQLFLERNLLHFPQKLSGALSYGNAVHSAVERMQRDMKVRGKLPDFASVLGFYEDALKTQRLNAQDFELYLQKGKDELAVYYEQRRESFFVEDVAELNFRQQNVTVGEARITGKIDRVHFEASGSDSMGANMAQVFDLKTGKPLEDWRNDSKSMRYMDQLVFYKLLMEGSRDYARYTVHEGFLEFVQPVNGEILVLPLAITPEMVEERRRLIEVVYGKIVRLELPDVSGYEKTAAGARKFREDLLEGRV